MIPYSVLDARDLLISSVLCKDPVIFIDDRWLYDEKDERKEIEKLNLEEVTSRTVLEGDDITIISSGYSTKISKNAIQIFNDTNKKFSIELIDLRVINPINYDLILKSICKTKRFIVVDGGWKTCGLASEIISSVVEKLDPNILLSKPINLSLKNCPAPSSNVLEKEYYLTEQDIVNSLERELLNN